MPEVLTPPLGSSLYGWESIAEKAIDDKHTQLGGDAGFLGPLMPHAAAGPADKVLPALQECADHTGYFKNYVGGRIYWVSTLGAHEVHGGILQKWGQLGFEKSILGYPLTDETATPDAVGRYNRFQNGMIYWAPATGAHEIHGGILAKWSQLGYEKSVSGYPSSDETATPDGVGRFNRFEHGVIYWTPGTGAQEVHGGILDKWLQLGYEKSVLGYPISDETATPDGAGRFNRFEHGVIYWTSTTGAHEVHGAILDKWTSIGSEHSALGYPVTDEEDAMDGGRVSFFQHGQIYWWPDIGIVVNIGSPLTAKPPQIVHLSGSIVFADGIAITSHYSVAITPNGNISAYIHAHCSSHVATYDYGVVIIISTPAGLTIAVQHGAHISNPLIGSTHDDDWNGNLTDNMVAANWGQFAQATVVHIGVSADTNIFGHSVTDLLQQGLEAIGKVAVDLLVG